MRGLKHSFAALQRYARIAPHVGARIETLPRISTFFATRIAPLVGARIETSGKNTSTLRTLPAPLVGARIETTAGRISSTILASHPTRVRGLNKPCMGGHGSKKDFLHESLFSFSIIKKLSKKLKNLLQNKQSYVILHNVIG